ncbi:MAG: septal ring lytic transglycosylase RlpA family protein [Gammaproteobacteria bacterium]|nr:septal ring lytic transglycosylase RlpA family protein [Gammaproteobacteria bacterium]
MAHKQGVTDRSSPRAAAADERQTAREGRSAIRPATRSLAILALLTLAWLPFGPGPQAAEKRAAETQKVQKAQKGVATYYAKRFHGRRTASGERLDQGKMVAAHPSLPFGTIVRVTNLRNGRSTDVRVVDRGPAKGPQRRGVIIDLTQTAARELGFKEQGKTPVRLDILGREAPEREVLLAQDDSPA